MPEVDAATPLSYGSQSTSPTLASTGTRTDRQMAKRRASSEWISLAIGEKVPYETDQAFRAALADGVTLCRLINWVRPGIIPKVRFRGGGVWKEGFIHVGDVALYCESG